MPGAGFFSGAGPSSPTFEGWDWEYAFDEAQGAMNSNSDDDPCTAGQSIFRWYSSTYSNNPSVFLESSFGNRPTWQSYANENVVQFEANDNDDLVVNTGWVTPTLPYTVVVIGYMFTFIVDGHLEWGNGNISTSPRGDAQGTRYSAQPASGIFAQAESIIDTGHLNMGVSVNRAGNTTHDVYAVGELNGVGTATTLASTLPAFDAGLCIDGTGDTNQEIKLSFIGIINGELTGNDVAGLWTQAIGRWTEGGTGN